MYEKTDPPIKPLWKTAVLWQSILALPCAHLLSTQVLPEAGIFTLISFVWSFIFMIISIRKKQYFRGLIPLLFSTLSLYPLFFGFLFIYLYGRSFAP
jgi:hypothetical protein